MTSVRATRNNTHWKTTSPIPVDPIYEKYTNKTQQLTIKTKSPIPKDPVYQSASDRRPSSPKPRVKPEALQIARNHQGRDLAYLFNPAFQIIPIGVKPTHRESKDYGKENFRKIKQIQKANREKQVESSRQTPVKAVYKPSKFDHVESKVVKRLQTPTAPRPSSADGRLQRSQSLSNISKLKREEERRSTHNKNQPDEKPVNKEFRKSNRPSSAQPRSLRNENDNRKEYRPSTSTKVYERPKSHIAQNKQAIKNTKLKRSPSMSALDELKKKKEKDFQDYKRGSVPKYLQTRKNEWKKAEEERIANLPDPSIPQGHSQMPEAERVQTLSLLKKSKSDLTKDLQSLPLSRDTVRIQNHRNDLERKLQEVDAALKIFSRPRVFVKDE